MLASFEQVVLDIELEDAELTAWIEQEWVLPAERDGGYVFDEADVARVRLISELRRDFGVNDEAIPVVLRLLDQVYSLRQALDQLNDAIGTLPEDARAQLRAELARIAGGGSPDA